MCGGCGSIRGQFHSRRGGEDGFVLTEIAVSLPMLALLLTVLAFAVVWSFRCYRQEIADAELRQEMQIAAARIVESALLSDRIRERQRGVYEMRQLLSNQEARGHVRMPVCTSRHLPCSRTRTRRVSITSR